MDRENIFFGEEANESWHLFLSNNDKLPLVVENIGKTDESPKYCVQRDSTSSLIVVEYVISGEGTLEINNTRYNIKTNDIYVIPPFTAHKYYSSSSNPLKKVWINFRSEMFKNILISLNINNKIVFENEASIGKIFFDEVIAISGKSNYSDDICFDLCPLIFNLFCSLFRYQYNVNISHVSINAQNIKRALDESLDTNISISDISLKLNYSKKQIMREFTKYYKVTPHQYLIQEKMKIAKTFLSATNLSIKEISYRLGFGSQHYFSNAFKKCCGCSPVDFRETKTKKMINNLKKEKQK